MKKSWRATQNPRPRRAERLIFHLSGSPSVRFFYCIISQITQSKCFAFFTVQNDLICYNNKVLENKELYEEIKKNN